ncbi:MAG TPA: hypothetical protein VFS30_00065 [Dehalococcoidia bacterium]|nr:hypothetical protein [Dehalococcoidia bacterium]
MKAKFSSYFAALVGLTLIIGAGVATLPTASPASADGFGNTLVTFTKYITTFPEMSGSVGGDVGEGEFVGTVLNVDSLAGGKILRLTAEYNFHGALHSSKAKVIVMQFNNKFAVLQGAVVDGWRKGALVHGIYKVIECDQAPDKICFDGQVNFWGGAP